MNLFNIFIFNIFKNRGKGKWILKGIFISLILGLGLIPVFSLAANKAPIVNAGSNKEVFEAINIGNLKPGQTKIITFQAKIVPAKNFSYGTTELINTALAYNVKLAKTETSKILVTKINGPTQVKTGLSDISFLNSILFPLILSFINYLGFQIKTFRFR